MHIKSQTKTLDRSLKPASFRYLDVTALGTSDARVGGDDSNGSNVGLPSLRNARPGVAFTGRPSSGCEIIFFSLDVNTLVLPGASSFSSTLRTDNRLFRRPASSRQAPGDDRFSIRQTMMKSAGKSLENTARTESFGALRTVRHAARRKKFDMFAGTVIHRINTENITLTYHDLFQFTYPDLNNISPPSPLRHVRRTLPLAFPSGNLISAGRSCFSSRCSPR